MKEYQKKFIEISLESGALKFGRFELKSGRVSPYFFNAGMFSEGLSLSKVADCYAAKIASLKMNFDMLFGPAYKGIGLVSVTSVALARDHKLNFPFAYNRKERKNHGEGGMSVGSPIKGKVLILDDVITAGTAIKQSIEIIKKAGAEPIGVLVALDREEVADNKNLSAVEQLQRDIGLKVKSIINLRDLIKHVHSSKEFEKLIPKILDYQERYGVNN